MGMYLKGEQDLIRKLRSLTSKDAKAAIRKGTRVGAKIVQASAKVHAPKLTGDLAADIKVRSLVRSQKYVGTTVRNAMFKGDRFYGGFQELGWKVGSRKLGDGRKQVPGRHYMKRAADEVGRQALEATAAEIWAEIERRAKA
jgi:HK97 gp10 family phage protein